MVVYFNGNTGNSPKLPDSGAVSWKNRISQSKGGQSRDPFKGSPLYAFNLIPGTYNLVAQSSVNQTGKLVRVTKHSVCYSKPCYLYGLKVGSYQVQFKMSEDHFKSFSTDQMNRLLNVIGELNQFAKNPILGFVFGHTGPAGNSHYCGFFHRVHLIQDVQGNKFPSVDQTIPLLVYGMGFGIYKSMFYADNDWRLIFDLSLNDGKYKFLEIDKNPKTKVNSSKGLLLKHVPAFGAVFSKYYLHADSFAKALQDPSLSQEKREFGKLIWCFMREEVFRGKVFTSDGKDPFSQESYSVLLNKMKGQREASLLDALKNGDSNVQAVAAGSLMKRASSFNKKEVVPTLVQSLKHTNPKVRRFAAIALGRMGAKEAIAELEALAKNDPESSVRDSAQRALEKLQGDSK